MTKYIYVCKLPIFLPSRQPSNLALILEYNTINQPDFLSDNKKNNIGPKESNNGEKRIRPVDINNEKKNIRLAYIEK